MTYASLFLAGSLLTLTATAQTRKGQTITSGEFGLSHQWGSTTGAGTSQPLSISGYNTNLNVTLNRGLFVRDNWLVGAAVGVGQSWQGTDVRYNQQAQFTYLGRQSNLLLRGYIRRYWPVIDRLFVYAGGGLQVTYALNKSQQTTTSSGQTAVSANASERATWSVDPLVSVGLLYAVSDRFGLEAGIRSNGLPIGVGTASFGVNVLTGRGGGAQAEGITALQTQAGRWLLGAALSASGNTSQYGGATVEKSDTRYTVSSLELSAGCFVRDNAVLGLALRGSTTATTNNLSATTNHVTTYGIAPFVRLYNGQTRLRLFVEGGVEFSSTIQSVNRALDQHQLGAQASVGIAYMLGQRFIVQSTLATLYGRYQWYPKPQDALSTDTYTVGLTGSTLSNLSVAYSF
ncbi:hypothetical protein [Fibrella aquatilis]|uniref:Outer membrane protein beta-barrel domain-containing protein n=1 Tax=Fibrella aquatilis TaxID=2817059 RepID=A0A939G562_9BACT|nr:hypothetical protein [Fibrella aquatilis]MBO0931393.1 hypothetical protein [Fibrella aquatilis]